MNYLKEALRNLDLVIAKKEGEIAGLRGAKELLLEVHRAVRVDSEGEGSEIAGDAG